MELNDVADVFGWFGIGRPLGIPTPVWITAVCFVIFSVIFHMLKPKKVAPEAAIYEIQKTQSEYDWHNWRTGMCTFEYFRSGQTEKDLELIIKKWINYQDR